MFEPHRYAPEAFSLSARVISFVLSMATLATLATLLLQAFGAHAPTQI